jgi:ubiquitin carboxyl-terminal hydrolase 5/13
MAVLLRLSFGRTDCRRTKRNEKQTRSQSKIQINQSINRSTKMNSFLTDGLVNRCRVATAHDTVLNSECAYTFHSPFTNSGILVNLNTFMGTVEELALSSSGASFSDESEGVFVRIYKTRLEKTMAIDDDDDVKQESSAAAPTKLGIGINGGFQAEEDLFQIEATYSVVVLKKDDTGTVFVAEEAPYNADTKDTFPEALQKSVDSIINHSGLALQQDLKVWELDDEPKPVSKYYETLPFVDNAVAISANPSDWKCEKSGDTENLWLNLSDGYIGGGRKNWDGSGGSNGALDHFHETGGNYPLVVKLGTITANVETADCYSYADDEDCPVLIPNLAALLEKRGIKVTSL